MASLTLADAASRIAPMTEGKKPKRWATKDAEPAEAHEAAAGDRNESRRIGPLSRPVDKAPGSEKARHNLYKKV